MESVQGKRVSSDNAQNRIRMKKHLNEAQISSVSMGCVPAAVAGMGIEKAMLVN